MRSNRQATDSPFPVTGRALARSILLAAAMGMPAAGCGALADSGSKPSHSLWPLGAQAKHEALRKAVEADSFPTARQAGVN